MKQILIGHKPYITNQYYEDNIESIGPWRILGQEKGLILPKLWEDIQEYQNLFNDPMKGYFLELIKSKGATDTELEGLSQELYKEEITSWTQLIGRYIDFGEVVCIIWAYDPYKNEVVKLKAHMNQQNLVKINFSYHMRLVKLHLLCKWRNLFNK